VQIALPDFVDEQRRLIAATVAGIRVVCAYFPNGQAVGSDKYAYKLRWIEALAAWLRGELQRHPQLALAGDFNVAPEDRDVHDPKLWEGQVLFSEPEKQAFRGLVALGLVDAFRLFEQPDRSYTWWDYRMLAFRRKMGLRIDHILVSSALAARCRACTIDIEPRRREQPSDHAPVILTIE
jgi:exodeoxyribonuclease-3